MASGHTTTPSPLGWPPRNAYVLLLRQYGNNTAGLRKSLNTAPMFGDYPSTHAVTELPLSPECNIRWPLLLTLGSTKLRRRPTTTLNPSKTATKYWRNGNQ